VWVCVQVRSAITAVEGRGCKRYGPAAREMRVPLAGVTLSLVKTDYEDLFQSTLNYKAMKYSKLSDVLRFECSDFLQMPSQSLSQYCTEV
jgi:hypothetical protein